MAYKRTYRKPRFRPRARAPYASRAQPIRKYNPKSRKFRKYKQKYTPNPPNLNTMLPPTMLIKARWGALYNMSVDGLSKTVPQIYRFRANSIWDPNYNESFGGDADKSIHGYSVYSQFYNSYRVHFAVFTVHVINHCDNDLAIGLQCKNKLQEDSTSLGGEPVTKYQHAILSQFCKTKTVGRVSSGQPISSCYMKYVVPLHSSIGLSKLEYKSQNGTKAVMGTDPKIVSYVQLLIWKIGDSNTQNLFVETGNEVTANNEWHGSNKTQSIATIKIRCKMYAKLSSRISIPFGS